MPRHAHTSLLLFLAMCGAAGTAQAKPQAYVDFPASYLPAAPQQHPRVYVQDRIPALQALYKANPKLDAVQAFQHDIDKLMGYSSADQDWRAESGWPAAALALHWLITGNAASGKKACDIYIPHFAGASNHNQESDLYYALAYDWLYNHPCFTNAMKADLRAKLVAWSDDTAKADEAGSWTPHDTDRNISATSGHFLAGLAILGEDKTNGLKLLKRGWTGWKVGINASSDLPDFPVASFFRASLGTGIPLPGWDYGMISDVRMAQNLYHVMDDLGVIDAEFPDIKAWWTTSLLSFMHSVDPANTHYRWIGDQQTDVRLAETSGYFWSYLSNCVYLAEKYGHKQEAAMGRSFLDSLAHPSYGIPEGDTMLWLMTAWTASAPRVDYRASAPRYVIGGLGPEQHMGVGMFRSDWASSASPKDAKQVTWGGFYGIGSYIVDHMHNSAGSFWLWRNGEYLLTEPLNYGGNEAAVYPATLWNSLSIPNEAVPNNNESYDNGGPVVYFNQGSAYLERGRAQQDASVFYALLNGDESYNVPDNPWVECTGTCRQPVSRYTRSFAYDGLSEVVMLVDRVDLARSRPVGLRFRTQNPTQLSTQVAADTVSVPSDKGSYRTLIRVMTPEPPAPWTIEKEPWKAPDYQIDPAMVGSQARLSFPTGLQHRVVTVLHLGPSSDGTGQLADAAPIGAAPDLLGACARSFCFLTPYNHLTKPLASVSYSTPATMAANTRHLVTDLEADACYSVTSSVGGAIATKVSVQPQDNTLLFEVPSGGAQDISITKDSGCTTGGAGGSWGSGGSGGSGGKGGSAGSAGKGGSGGSAGSGGQGGSGGKGGGAGAAAGAGGAGGGAAGGAGEAGAASGQGGAGGKGGGAGKSGTSGQGGAGGKGGAGAAGPGGGGGAGQGGAPASAPGADAGDDGGCSCGVPRTERPRAWEALAGVLGLGLLRRARRGRTRAGNAAPT